MRPDNKKIAAIAMLTAGQATLSEVARLAGTSRQRVQHWARYGIEHKGPPWPSGPTSRLDLDVKAARDGLLARQWAAELEKLEVEDREANTEQEWQTLKAMAKAGRETKVRPRRR
jgi:transposase-like protein